MGRSCGSPVELAGELLLGQIRKLKTMKKWRVVSNGLTRPKRQRLEPSLTRPITLASYS